MAIASVVMLVSCFLPWYGINSRVINEWWNAFGSIGSVAGYIIATFSLIILAVILLPVMKPDFDMQKRLPWKESSLLLFLSSQSLFISLIFIPVYTQYSLINATNSGTRFGIYITLIAALVASIVALSYSKKVSENNLRQPDFAKVPRPHRAVNYWQKEDEGFVEEESEEGFEQEAMFEESPESHSESGEESLSAEPELETALEKETEPESEVLAEESDQPGML